MAKKARGKATKKVNSSARKKTQGAAAQKSRKNSSGKEEALLLVGTMKGAFVLRSDKSRRKWKIEGPHFRGEAVYALLHDTRTGRGRTFAASLFRHSQISQLDSTIPPPPGRDSA